LDKKRKGGFVWERRVIERERERVEAAIENEASNFFFDFWMGNKMC